MRSVFGKQIGMLDIKTVGHFLEHLEDILEGLLISSLRSRKACAINPVIEFRVQAVIEAVHLSLQSRREKIMVIAGKSAKSRIEHPHDVCRFIVDGSIQCLVPQQGNRGAPRKLWVSLGIELMHVVLPFTVSRVAPG